jgi:Salmonella virulence plasmid 65kDa B protein
MVRYARRSPQHAARIACILSLLIWLTGSPGKVQAGDIAGATAGELGVSAEGSANYAVEIAVPPGTTGVQPKLSLRYDSQVGNGVLGVGFSLGGLSAISRCGKTLPIDGTITAVDYSSNDRFCLDGQRLVPVSGSYGADGTEYRIRATGSGPSPTLPKHGAARRPMESRRRAGRRALPMT